jgi:hypothetical protein
MSEMKMPVTDAPSGASTTGRMVGVPRRWLAALMALLVVPWLVVGAVWLWPASDSDADVVPDIAASSPAMVGPWGELVVTPVTISPPIEYVSRTWGELQPSVWHFPPMTGDELERLLVSFGLTGEAAARLRNTARSAAPVPGLFVVPDAALVEGLTPDVRARIYLWLGRSALSGYTDAPVNFDQVASYRFFGDSIEDWLAAPLSPETRRLVEPYIYRHNGFMYFADIEQVRSRIGDADELQRLAKRLLRHATVLVYLRVPEASAVDRVAEYWGRGGRRTDLRPLLESVERRAVSADRLEGTIDISHLLPSLAREYLYRYPRPSVEDLQRPLLANCLWTVLNFFDAEPDDRYLDPAVSLAALKSDYYLVQDNFQLGDVVAFSDRHGNLVHVAVYLAGDLLFSKNGTAPLSPWSILPLERFKGHYVEYGDDWKITYHRRKDM